MGLGSAMISVGIAGFVGGFGWLHWFLGLGSVRVGVGFSEHEHEVSLWMRVCFHWGSGARHMCWYAFRRRRRRVALV